MDGWIKFLSKYLQSKYWRDIIILLVSSFGTFVFFANQATQNILLQRNLLGYKKRPSKLREELQWVCFSYMFRYISFSSICFVIFCCWSYFWIKYYIPIPLNCKKKTFSLNKRTKTFKQKQAYANKTQMATFHTLISEWISSSRFLCHETVALSATLFSPSLPPVPGWRRSSRFLQWLSSPLMPLPSFIKVCLGAQLIVFAKFERCNTEKAGNTRAVITHSFYSHSSFFFIFNYFCFSFLC